MKFNYEITDLLRNIAILWTGNELFTRANGNLSVYIYDIKLSCTLTRLYFHGRTVQVHISTKIITSDQHI